MTQTLKCILAFPSPVWQSNEPHETMPIAAFGQKQRPSRFFMTPPRLPYTPSLQSPITVSHCFPLVLVTQVFLIHVKAVILKKAFEINFLTLFSKIKILAKLSEKKKAINLDVLSFIGQ